MANVRDSDTSLWLHNKLGTSNDSWISGSICSQLNKEVLRNIKECFPDLQTQVKLKLLLSFFHIPRRLVEEWKTELEEVIEVAGLDSELWVSMLAETMKTFPATSSLNTEISDYEDTRPIFTDMVNDLRKLVSKHSDLGMLPLECQYLNKNALVSVVGQQQNPVKHFTLKRKPKSANLRTELLHKSADAQSSLKKASAPTIPLRSRGMPRKMTDTTPLKGIPSRVPTSGFRSPIVPVNQQRPNLSRTPAGRKDGGIKLIEFTEQPLGYAAAKKRKREQQLEEQQKKQEQKLQNAAAAAAAAAGTGNASPITSPLQTSSGTGLATGTPTTPITSINASFEIKTEPSVASLNQSLEESNATEVNEVVRVGVATAKPEPITPDYAPALAYTTQPATPAVINTVNTSNTANVEESKSHSKTIITMSNAGTAASAAAAAAAAITTNTIPKVTSISVLAQPSNNNNNMNHKRIKQEIEIKSEEILVPPTIKVEKIDALAHQDATTQILLQQKQQVQLQQHQQQQQASQVARLQQQRVIIQQQPQQQQQQPQTQHVLIRTAPQQQKQTIIGGMTTLATTVATAARQKINAINTAPGTTIKMEKLDIKPLIKSTPATTLLTQQQLRQGVANPLANLPNNISVKITSTKATKASQQQQKQQQQQQQPILINSSTPVILASSPAAQSIRQQTVTNSNTTTASQTLKSMPLSQLKSAANSGPVIISQTIIQPAKRAATAAGTSGTTTNVISSHQQQQQQQQQPAVQQHQQQQTTTQYILTSSAPQQQQKQQSTSMPTLASFTQVSRAATGVGQQTTLYQTAGGTTITGSTPNSTKILLKTSTSSGGVMMTPMRQQHQTTTTGLNVVGGANPPPLIATSTSAVTQQPTMLNIQNVQLPNRPVTIQPASQAAQQQHLQAQLQQQQPQQHTIVSNTTATQQPKLTQVLVQSNPSTIGGVNVNAPNAGVKNKTIYLTQKGVILRNIGGDMYQQIPISNVSGLQTLGTGTTTLMTTSAGPPGLVKTTQSNMVQQPQTIQLQTQQQQPAKQHLPTLIQNTMTPQHLIVQQQPTQTNLLANNTQQTIIRPVMSGLQAGLTTLPQGLTLIQRPGQQPQLVQVQAAPAAPQQQTQIQRTIITQQPAQQQHLRPQQIVLQHKRGAQQRIITTSETNVAAAAAGGQQIQIQQSNPIASRIFQISQQPQQQQTATQQPQRKSILLSNEHVHKAHEMFLKANRISRPDKALILGFMAGLRENPRPNSENVIVIKLGDKEEKVQQEDGSTAFCLVESLIRLDYNTGEWKTFQNYRRIDQSSQGQQATDAGMQTQNSVVI